MQKPAIAYNEELRLLELYSYTILDTEEEDEFNSIALLAAEICNTKISAISLVDRDRQWFKAKVGLDENETDRLFSFCAHTILKDTPNVVNDTRKDERFCDNPYVLKDNGINFYAGFPIFSQNGFCLGALAVLDVEVQTLDDKQIKTMQLLAKQVMYLLEIRKQNIQVTASKSKYKNLLDNLNEGFFIDDLEGKVAFANNKFLEIFGITTDDLINFNIKNYVCEEYLDETKNRHYNRINGKPAETTFEYLGKKKNGEKIWLRANVTKVFEEGKIIGSQTLLLDISSEKKIILKNNAYNDLLEAINMINSLLLNFNKTKDINQSICDILVSIAPFKMAWIGWVNEETQQVEPIAVYGDKFNYVKNINISIYPKSNSLDSIGISIIENKPQTINYELKNNINCKSSVSIPIIINKTNKGVLVLYSEQENYFGQKEILTLESIITNYIIASERNEFKKSLLEKEYFISAIADNAPALIAYFDNNLICKYVNQEIVRLKKMQPLQIIEKHFSTIYGDEIYAHYSENLQKALEGKEVEFEYTTSIGTTSKVYSSKLVPHIIADKVVGLFSFSYDVSTLKNQAKQLKKDANILHNIHDAILISDLNEKLIYYNSIAENIFGYTKKEVLGKKAFFLQHIEGENDANLIFEKILKAKTSNNTWKAITKNGAVIWLKINSSPYYDESNEMIGVIETCIDITEQKTNEIELQKTKELLESTNAIAKIGNWDINIITNDFFWTKENYVMFGLQNLDKDELQAMYIQNTIASERNELEKLRSQAIKTGKGFVYEFQYKMRDGTIKFFENIGEPYRDKEGKTIGIRGVNQDITERKLIEQNLERTKLELNSIIDNVPFSIFMKNLKGEYLFTNKAFKERTKADTSITTRAGDIFSPSETREIENTDAEVIKNKTNTFKNLTIGNKELFTIKFPVLNHKNKLIAIGGVAIDITDKLNQEKLIDELNKKYREELEQKQLVKIQSLIEGQEEERKRISKDLHDGIGQTLSLCNLYATSLVDFIGSEDERKRRKIELNNSIKQAIAEVRAISSNLMPSELTDYGLIVSLSNLFLKINTSGKIKINFTTNITNRINSNIEVSVFRILQEIINNTLKHAKATDLNIKIVLLNNNLLIETQDNGIGFNTENVQHGNGLNNIKQRTQSLLGKVQIHTNPTKGCGFSIQLPLLI